MADQLNLTFSGFDADIEGGRFSLRPGVEPSTGQLTLAASVTVDQVKGSSKGTLSFTSGGSQVQLRDIFVDTVREDQATKVVEVTLKDKRWLWPFHTITGEFNQLDDNGKIRERKSKKKTVRKLAKLLLKSMDETSVDVSALPRNSFPHKVWDFANSAEELALIAEETDTVIILTLENKVVFRKKGEGSAPEGAFIGGQTIGDDLFDGPDTIQVVGSKNIFQIEETLVPMAEVHTAFSTDDTPLTKIVPLAQAQYEKTDGTRPFGEVTIIAEMLHEFSNLIERDKLVARGSVGKLFGGITNLPVLNEISLKTELEESPGVVELITGSPLVNTAKSEPSRELGFIKEENERTQGGFQIDAQNGLVQFDDRQLVRNSDVDIFEFDGDIKIAKIKLTYAFKHEARNKKDGPDEDSFYTFVLNRFGGKRKQGRVAVVFAEELQVHLTFNPFTNKFIQDKAEKKELDRQARRIAEDRLAKFTEESAETIRFIGIEGIEPSGKIEAVTWEVSKIADTVVEFTRRTPASIFEQRKAEEPAPDTISNEARFTSFGDISGDVRFVINKSGITIPPLALVISDGIDSESGLIKIKRPIADNLGNIFINENNLLDGNIGKARDSGTYAVKYSETAPLVGQFLGTVTDSFISKVTPFGGLKVRGVLDATDKIAQVKIEESAIGVEGLHFVGSPLLPQIANLTPPPPGFAFNGIDETLIFFNLWVKNSTTKLHADGHPAGFPAVSMDVWGYNVVEAVWENILENVGSGVNVGFKTFGNSQQSRTEHVIRNDTLTSSTANTITDSGAAFTIDGLIGNTLQINTGAGSGQSKVIISNTATVITVESNWHTNPPAASAYQVTDNQDNFLGGALQVSRQGGAIALDTPASHDDIAFVDWTKGFFFNIDSGAGITSTRTWIGAAGAQFTSQVDDTSDPETNVTFRAEKTTEEAGTATSGTLSSMTDGGASFGALTGKTLSITSGLGIGQARVISSNSGTVINVEPDFHTAPDATSVYTVITVTYPNIIKFGDPRIGEIF